MPTFVSGGNLVHFAVFKNHIGFYPVPDTIIKSAKDVKFYKTSKGAVQFPLNGDLPEKLIVQMVRYRASKNKKFLKLKIFDYLCYNT